MGLTPQRRTLGCFPTPLHPDERLAAFLGLDELWLKRDDLTGFAWGGNKVRAVEFLIGAALDMHTTIVVMASGPSSNFAATMTAAASAAGLSVEQVCYGTEPDHPPMALRAVRALGATVVFTGSADRSSMEAVAAERVEALRSAGQIPFAVPRGGATAVGSLGFFHAAFELADQLETLGLDRAHVVIAVGSGGSIAGLLAGQAAAGKCWSVHGVSVSRPVEDFRPTIAGHAEACAELASTELGGPAGLKVPSFELADGRGAGFGVSQPDEIDLMDKMEREFGLLIDPVYNAKALKWLATAELAGPVIYWHTGGALGAADRLNKPLPQT